MLRPLRVARALRESFAAFYGPDSRFLHEMIGMVRHGFAPLLGPEHSFISSVSHDDAASAVVRALDVEAGIYNVGDDEPVRHREFTDALAEALGVSPPRLPPGWLVAISGSIGQTLARSVRLANGKLRERGWGPRYRSVREGFSAVAREIESGRATGHTGQPGFRA